MRRTLFLGISVALLCERCLGMIYPPLTNDASLHMPLVGENELHILSSNLLELRLITTKTLVQSVQQWNFVSGLGLANNMPGPQEFVVLVNGTPDAVTTVGFKRRPLYAPLADYDLRIDNLVYLQLATNITANQTVIVQNPDASLWAPTMQFKATASPLRYSPAIHVNQVGYIPTMPKQAMVGYYLGGLGEMAITATNFQIVDAHSGAVVFNGALTPRPDIGYSYTPMPYQNVYQADFSSFTNSGEYQMVVPGLGASYPFFIDDGVAAAFARAYELGLYEQRSGTATTLPFTRFTHAADHTAPASVPVPQSQFTDAWNIIASYGAAANGNNPPQTAPLLTNAAAQLYPFVNTGAVDVAGGHFDAGDYSKYTWDSAQMVHVLMFAVDSLPGVAALDNLGIPESGDGISDVMEEAKWEADFLAKMQDADGGFYYLVYPRNREYENNVLPENGDPQIVWPKNTVATAAAVAALAQCASSPLFKKTYPQAASNYWAKAQMGWQFLTNAVARYGLAGSYQKLIHYGDDFTHNDELAWASCEMYLATGNPQYQQALFQMLPDPTSPSTFMYGWWRMYQCYGNAIRDYAFAARSGRLSTNQLDPTYLNQCETEIIAAAQDQLTRSQDNAYGTSFPLETKAVRTAGWYFSMDQAFDLAVASALNDYPPLNDPRPQFLAALLNNMNYEGGCNPVNICFVEGLGWKRQRDIVSQYALNDGRVLPPSGIPVGNIVGGFDYLALYQGELGGLTFPSDGATSAPYPVYDRWGDSWIVETEQTIVNQARQLATATFLMAKTTAASQAWKSASAQINVPATAAISNAVTATITVPNFNLSQARVVWEAQGQEPVFGTNFVFTPVNPGSNWIEVEAQWPDGRRVFAATNFFLTNGPPIVTVAATAPLAVIGSTNYGTFTFTRNGDLGTSLSVYYLFSGGVDFEQSVTIPAGAASCTVNIVPAGNFPTADLETVALTLVNGTGYNVGSQNNATVSIVNPAANILHLARSPPGGVTLQWTSVPGFVYQVLAKNNLGDANWTVLSGDILAVSTNSSWTDDSTTGVPQRFYVVQGSAADGVHIFSLVPSAPNPASGLAGGMTLSWTSLPGQVYHVLFKNNLTDANGTDLSGPLIATDTITSWMDTLTTGIPQRFYLIEETQ
ncbi:MAG TPA: glycoside hydrolase family 9 protein [Verrucomicrobiae bacterium]|nr:glycoside hydrolase family 9 protein [Verrucomicrobiae bacterium]